VTFVTFAATGGRLRASQIFASLALFTIMQRYLNALPSFFSTATQMAISSQRLTRFLTQRERQATPSYTRREAAADGGGGARSHCRSALPLIRFITDSL
jgi:hypothetical protein